MVTKLINKLKYYFNNIWCIEIVYLFLYCLYILIGINNNFDSISEFTGYKGKAVNEVYFWTFTSICVFISLKLIVILYKRKGKITVKKNFVYSFFYVIRYGFKFKNTKCFLMWLIVCNIIFLITYLYLMAVGNYGNNFLARFFLLYPIKGAVIIMILPTVGILYSIKKNIEINKINEKIINNTIIDLQNEINSQTSKEIINLINNISVLKKRYENAIDETLTNERLKTELISNVSHDLRTPLTSIINYVNILKGNSITQEERDAYLDILDSKSKKLKLLIDDLFEMSKINSGKMVLNKEKIDIVSLIHQTIGEYSSFYECKKLKFNVETANEEVYISLDGKMISRAIENIVINAIKYSLDNTRIYVEIKTKNKMLEISFKNISNYYMDFDPEEIFERFVRADKSRTSKVDGSGLGLAITKSIIELHDGYVRITREADMFKIFIYLPLDDSKKTI